MQKIIKTFHRQKKRNKNKNVTKKKLLNIKFQDFSLSLNYLERLARQNYLLGQRFHIFYQFIVNKPILYKLQSIDFCVFV